MARVLFVCLHNAGRSQMSQALFERAAGGTHEAESAGTTPAERVHPEVVAAMGELGVDLSDRRPKPLSDEMAKRADVVVTMGCGDECPYVPGTRYLDWDLPDPKGRPPEEVRRTRDEIRRRVEGLVAELDSSSARDDSPGGRTLVFEAHAPQDLGRVTYLIHDQWFNVADVAYDPEARTLTVPFDREDRDAAVTERTGLLFRLVRIPSFRWYLKFESVRDYEIIDTERVGTYDFNEVVYDEEKKRFSVETNIPLRMYVDVDDIHVLVESSHASGTSARRRELRRRRSRPLG
jgi:arsenate reductase (thioredoxin)